MPGAVVSLDDPLTGVRRIRLVSLQISRTGSEMVFALRAISRLQSVAAYPWMARITATLLVNADSAAILTRSRRCGKLDFGLIPANHAIERFLARSVT